MKFNYQASSLEDIALHLNTLTRQAYFRTLTYYQNLDDSAMTLKLQKAKLLSQIYRLQAEMEALG